jgi:hypothetical protein
MPRLLLGLAVIVVVVTIYAVVDCAMMANDRVRGLPKPVWIVVIIVLPVIGIVLWFLIGRGRKNTAVATGPRAPDDDPAFLGRLGRDAEQDDRIRRLEEELAALDSESTDPDGPAPGHPETLPDDQADHGADRQDGDSRDR